MSAILVFFYHFIYHIYFYHIIFLFMLDSPLSLRSISHRKTH